MGAQFITHLRFMGCYPQGIKIDQAAPQVMPSHRVGDTCNCAREATQEPLHDALEDPARGNSATLSLRAQGFPSNRESGWKMGRIDGIGQWFLVENREQIGRNRQETHEKPRFDQEKIGVLWLFPVGSSNQSTKLPFPFGSFASSPARMVWPQRYHWLVLIHWF